MALPFECRKTAAPFLRLRRNVNGERPDPAPVVWTNLQSGNSQRADTAARLHTVRAMRGLPVSVQRLRLLGAERRVYEKQND